MTSNGRHDMTVSSLAHYWDELVQGRSADSANLDPALAATVRHLHAYDDALGVDQRFADRLLEDLMHTTTHRDPSVVDLVPSHSQVHASRAAARPRPQIGTFAPHRALAQVAAAAVLLLTIVASLLAVGHGRFTWQEDAPVFLPALGGTPATPETVTTETLLETEVAALPAGRIRVSVDRWRLKPSPAAVTLPPYEAIQLFTVDAGEVTVDAAGAEHRLEPGDTLDLTGQEFSFRASGSTEAVAYVVYISSKFSAEFGHGATRTWLSGDPLVHATDVVLSSSADDFAGGPVRLVLERLTVPPGTALPPHEARPLVWTEVGQGTLALTLEGERVPYGWTSGVEQKVRFGEYAVPQELPPGITVRMRNAGDDPLILYHLTLTPSEAGLSDAVSPGMAATPPG